MRKAKTSIAAHPPSSLAPPGWLRPSVGLSGAFGDLSCSVDQSYDDAVDSCRFNIHQLSRCKRFCTADSVNTLGANSDPSIKRRVVSQEWREPPDVALPGILACAFLLCAHITLKMNLSCSHIPTCGSCQTCGCVMITLSMSGKPPSLEDRYVTTCTLLALQGIAFHSKGFAKVSDSWEYINIYIYNIYIYRYTFEMPRTADFEDFQYQHSFLNGYPFDMISLHVPQGRTQRAVPVPLSFLEGQCLDSRWMRRVLICT